MAHDGEPHAAIPKALDAAEYFPVLLKDSDQTDWYLRYLKGMAEQDSRFLSAVLAFDEEA